MSGAQIPTNLLPYDSYTIDPRWQRKFTIIWTSVLAFSFLVSLPRIIRSFKRGRAFNGLFGVREEWNQKPYAPVQECSVRSDRELGLGWQNWWRVMGMWYWTIPLLNVNLGQVIILVGYFVTVVLCIVLKAELYYIPNRPGFLAIAQLPVVFLLATKNSVFSLLLGPGYGYERLNIIHRWSGRILFLSVTIHGAMWIQQHLQYNMPILGPPIETSGVASFCMLCIVFLTSLRPVRRMFYQGFFVIHVLGYVSFIIVMCIHTTFAVPWIFAPLAFYGLDLVMRMFRYRIKDAVLVPVDNQMTRIHVKDCSDGWQAGQHMRLRVFFSGRVFESHPFSILNAPHSLSSISSADGGLILGARAVGDWTKTLNNYAQVERDRLIQLSEKTGRDVRVQVMLDGPYGGSSIDIGSYESVLLMSGGSGATFALGLLDDIIGRCVKMGRKGGEVTRRIEFVWCIRSFGCIEWFSPMLMDLANAASGTSIDLHISIYVTCLCNPEAIPPIPNSIVTIEKPSAFNVLQSFITPSPSRRESVRSSGVSSDIEKSLVSSIDDREITEERRNPSAWQDVGVSRGGLGVCVSGPASLAREVSNAVAQLGLSQSADIGDVGLHTEVFEL